VISALAAALIGAGGSVVGGIVGGWLALVAVRSQWRRDRADARADRSHNAAMSIAEAVASMEEALVAWGAGQSSLAALRAAFNTFSRTAAVQSIAVTDSVVRQRVRRHVELLARVATLAETQPPAAAELIPTSRCHTDAVIDALTAHYNDAALPAYRPLPLEDAVALLAWHSPPAEGDSQRAAGVAPGAAVPAPGDQDEPH
jgi:hypothetical protein